MHSPVRFANIAAGGNFTTADLYQPALDALGRTESQCSLASLRYDLSKLRAKGLVEKIPHSRRYRLVGKGYSICVVFFKLFEKIYAPLTAGLLAPFRGDRALARSSRPLFFKSPTSSFLFCVHGKDGLFVGQESLHFPMDVFEVGLAVGLGAPFLGLAVGLPAVAHSSNSWATTG
jgi:hypothetical protein